MPCRFQFSLRTAFILLTALATWLAFAAENARRQRFCTSFIREHGGVVIYEHQCSNTHRQANLATEGPGPRFLRQVLGPDFFDKATIVSLFGGHRGTLTDQDLAIIAQLPHLRSLSLTGQTRLTDAGLCYLRNAQHLEELFLRRVPVTDRGLRCISAFRSLRRLDLEATLITDHGIKDLQSLTRLTDLRLSACNVGDTAVSHLAQLPQLQVLYLDATHITDRALTNLHTFRSLRELRIGETRVTNDGVHLLRAVRSLEELSLAALPVSDAGLRDLEGTKLRTLDLQQTRITNEAAKSLATMQALESLAIGATSMDHNALSDLANLPRLKHVSVGRRVPSTVRAKMPTCTID